MGTNALVTCFILIGIISSVGIVGMWGGIALTLSAVFGTLALDTSISNDVFKRLRPQQLEMRRAVKKWQTWQKKIHAATSNITIAWCLFVVTFPISYPYVWFVRRLKNEPRSPVRHEQRQEVPVKHGGANSGRRNPPKHECGNQNEKRIAEQKIKEAMRISVSMTTLEAVSLAFIVAVVAFVLLMAAIGYLAG